MIIQHHFMWGNNHGSECSYTLFYWFRVQSYREDLKNKTTLCRFEALIGCYPANYSLPNRIGLFHAKNVSLLSGTVFEFCRLHD